MELPNRGFEFLVVALMPRTGSFSTQLNCCINEGCVLLRIQGIRRPWLTMPCVSLPIVDPTVPFLCKVEHQTECATIVFVVIRVIPGDSSDSIKYDRGSIIIGTGKHQRELYIQQNVRQAFYAIANSSTYISG